MDNEPNFSEYSYDDLLNAEKYIDKKMYPHRYEVVIKLLNDPNHIPKGKTKTLEKIEQDKYSTFWPATIDGILFALILYIEC